MDKSFDTTYGLMTKKKHKDEIGDVKVYIIDAKNNVLCKTQVPIWDIQVAWQPEILHEELKGGKESV